jgi:hypothetical protein
MQGKRLPVVDGQLTIPEHPGEYCGPLMGYTGFLSAVFFLKPNARDVDAPKAARRLHHVCSPPHFFFEESDGTLTIKNSIGDLHEGVSDGWHGHLEKGVWRKV